MGAFERWRVGEIKRGVPAKTWNEFVRVGQTVDDWKQRGLGEHHTLPPNCLTIRGKAVEAMNFGHAVSFSEPVYPVGGASTIDSVALGSPPFLSLSNTTNGDPGTRWGVVTYGALLGGVASVAIKGIVWARVNVVSGTNLKTAGPVSGSGVLRTGEPGATVVWAEDQALTGGSQYGEQWAIIDLDGSGGVTTTTGAMAMVVQDCAAFSAISGTVFTATPGRTVNAARVLDWKRDVNGHVEIPVASLEPATEEDPLNPGTSQGVIRDLINLTGTTLRASVGEPIIVTGYLQDIASDNGDDSVFVATGYDMRSLPNFVLGTIAADHAQAPYHAGASREFRLDREDC